MAIKDLDVTLIFYCVWCFFCGAGCQRRLYNFFAKGNCLKLVHAGLFLLLSAPLLNPISNANAFGYCIAHEFGSYYPDMERQFAAADHQTAGELFCETSPTWYFCPSTPVYSPSASCVGTAKCVQSPTSSHTCESFSFIYIGCPTEQGGLEPFDAYDNGCGCANKGQTAFNDPANALVGCTPLPDENDGDDCNLTRHPCNVATGNKYRSETDFSINDLAFTRAYNSNTLLYLGLGKGWRHNHQKSLMVSGDTLTAVSATGKGELWTKTADIWSGDADSDLAITENVNGFELTKANGSKQNYALDGRILTQTDTNGHQTSYTYNVEGQLETVTNHYGLSITFTYLSGILETVSDPLGATYRYEYNNNNLSAVVFPDTTPGDDTDNPRKVYHYENSTYPSHLTGITDENGDRFGTYTYDSNGKAIRSEKGQTSNPEGQERIQLDYQGGQ